MSLSFALGFACSLLCTRIHTVIGFDEYGPSCRAYIGVGFTLAFKRSMFKAISNFTEICVELCLY